MNAAPNINSNWAADGFAPTRAFQVFGMRRSGNHAIIDWLMRNAPHEATGGVFYNNCKPYANPLKTWATFDIYDAEAAIIPPVYRKAAERFPEAGANPFALVSYEDFVPNAEQRPARASKGFRSRDFAKSIVIYRSFLNWLASFLAKLQRNPDFSALWRFKVMTAALPHYIETLARARAPGYVGICYDEWMTSDSYRVDKLAELDLPNRDNSRGILQRFGGGSSFQKKVANVSELATTDRAASMADDPEYRMILWIAAHDSSFMDGLIPVFKSEARRILQMAESAELKMTLPLKKVQE